MLLPLHLNLPAAAGPGGPNPFAARGLITAFPPGIYRHRAEWAWLWQQMVFCLPFNDPVMNGGFPFGDGDRKFQCYDAGPARMGSGGRALGPVVTPAHRSGSGAPGFDGPVKHVGNAGVVFENGSSASAGSASGLRYDPALGGVAPNFWNTSGPAGGWTLAIVFRNAAGGGVGNRRLFFWKNTVISFTEGISFSDTSAQWDTFLSALTVPHVNNRRSVYVFTGRIGSPVVRQIYQDGVLLGSAANAPIGSGDLALDLGFSVDSKALFSTTAGSHLELVVVTNRYWSEGQVRQFSGEPFRFLEVRPRRRRLVEVPPFVPGPPACLTAGLSAQSRVDARAEAEERVHAGVDALARVGARAEAMGRARASISAGSRVRAHADACKPEKR